MLSFYSKSKQKYSITRSSFDTKLILSTKIQNTIAAFRRVTLIFISTPKAFQRKTCVKMERKIRNCFRHCCSCLSMQELDKSFYSTVKNVIHNWLHHHMLSIAVLSLASHTQLSQSFFIARCIHFKWFTSLDGMDYRNAL
jgi:phosphoenolpyruvate carboxylase